jgi:hypothetical protein
MGTQRIAEIQVVVEGIRLPATRDELVSYARRYDAAAAEQLASLPKGSYDSIDAAAEALRRVQPSPRDAQPLPASANGSPPGGSDYLTARPVPGSVQRSARAEQAKPRPGLVPTTQPPAAPSAGSPCTADRAPTGTPP